jgi:hypothetical protein
MTAAASCMGKQRRSVSRPVPHPLLAGNKLAADSAMFSSWLEARAAGNTELELVLVRRFTPDYREAFDEWLKLDPLNNPSATSGPAYMPGYKNPNLDEAEQLNTEAEELFTEGTEAGEMAGKCLRSTASRSSVSRFSAESESRFD